MTSDDNHEFRVGTTLSLESLPGDIALLTLNRPEARNSLTVDVWNDLANVLRWIETHSYRGVILTGSGPTFCAGGDLKSGPELGSRSHRRAGRLELAHKVLTQLWNFPLPIVAAVQGPAIGLGWSLVLACDVIVMHQDAYFSAPFTSLGVIPDGGLAWLLTRTVGRYRASEIILSGRRLSSREALSIGLANEIADGDVVAAASKILGAFAFGSPDAVELTGTLIKATSGTTFEQFLSLEISAAALAQSGPDAAEGRRAFADKNAPTWQLPLNQDQ